MKPIQAQGYFFTSPNQPFEKKEFIIDTLQDDEVIIKVAGCGLCHTDISFLTGQVKTKHELPLILGHEISGTVIQTGKHAKQFAENKVVIPAVLPCGECEICVSGRDNICQAQLMPGNDFHGGFATHIKVQAQHLCVLPEYLGDIKLSAFSVVADAMTTPYQSLKRSNLQDGDVAIIVGVGGVGTYMVQHGKNVGAIVIALDIDEKKLSHAKTMGAAHTICIKGMPEHEVKQAVRKLVKENNLKKFGWKVFEMSGTSPGQMVAFSLLSFAGTLGVIGFTMDKANIRLSNVMAFDADIFGNWGCSPKYYSDVVADVLSGKINVLDNIEEHSLDQINEIIPMALEHKLEKRVIFIP